MYKINSEFNYKIESYFYKTPPEIYIKIISFLDVNSIINLSLSCKKFYNYSYYSKNENVKELFQHIFNQKIINLYRINPKDLLPFCYEVGLFPIMPISTALLNTTLTAANGDIKLFNIFKEHSKINLISFEPILFYSAISNGNFDLLKNLLKNYTSLISLLPGFYIACNRGNIDVVQLMLKEVSLSEPKYIFHAIFLSLRNGQINVINVIFNYLKNINDIDDVSFILNCIRSKNYEFIKKIITKYVPILKIFDYVFIFGIFKAIKLNQLKILDWLLKFYDSYYNDGKKYLLPFKYLLTSKISKKTIEFLIKNKRLELSKITIDVLLMALEQKKFDCVALLLDEVYLKNINQIIEHSSLVNRLSTMMISSKNVLTKDQVHTLLLPIIKKEKKSKLIYNFLLKIAINYDNFQLLETLINEIFSIQKKKGKIIFSDELIKFAIKKGEVKSIEILINKLPISCFTENIDAIKLCILFGNIELVQLLIKKIGISNNDFLTDVVIPDLCNEGKLEMLQFIIKELKIKELNYNYLIIICTEKGHWEIIQFLLKQYVRNLHEL